MSKVENPNFEQIDEGLEGEYEGRIEVIGDIHETDLGEYKDFLESKYGEDSLDAISLDGILVTGDLYHNSQIDGSATNTPESDLERLEINLEYLDEIGERLETDVYVIPGNHAPIKGAHPGNEQAVEVLEEIYEEKHDSISKNIYKDLVSKKENVEDIEYSTKQIGDKTLIGGSHFYDPEDDPNEIQSPNIEEIYDEEDLEEIAEILTEEQELDYGVLGDLPYIGEPYRKVCDFLFTDEFLGKKQVEISEIELEDIESLSEDIREEVIVEEHRKYIQDVEESSGEYEEKKQKYSELFEQAGDEVILLDHFTFDTEGQSEIDHLGGEHKGSPALRDVIKQHSSDKDITTFFGHSHSGGKDQVFGVDMYNLGKGQYLEAGFGEDGIEASRYQSQSRSDEGSENKRGQQQMMDEVPDEVIEDMGIDIQEVMGITGIKDKEEAKARILRGLMAQRRGLA